MPGSLRLLWRALLFLCGVVSMWNAAGAVMASVLVRSGEHPGHSRLVLEFERLPGWRLEPRPGGYALTFDPPQEGFRLDDVFRYIPKRRLTGIRPDGQGGLVLDLGCACEVRTVVMRSRALVVDILDPEDPGPAATIEAMIDGPIVLVTSANRGTPPDIPEPHDEPPLSPLSELPPEAPVLPFTGGMTPDEPPPGSGLTRALAQEVARAAAQGMVDADRALWRSESTSEDANYETAATHEDEIATVSESSDNIRIRTSMDAALEPSGDTDLPAQLARIACPDPRAFAVETWADDRPYNVQIAELRRHLVGEFDKPNKRAALSLVRLYINLTFGAEARNLIRDMLGEAPELSNLVALSYLIEEGSAGGALADYADCGGSLPLWALIDEDPAKTLRPVRADAVLLSFSSLPPHLRRLLGYKVAARFAARSDYSSAEIVRAALERVSEPGDPALILSSTQVHQDEGLPPVTEEALGLLAISLRPEAAEALLLDIDGRLARQESIPTDLVDTAASLAFELDGSEEGYRVKTAEIRARLANGDYDTAFEELLRVSDAGGLPQDARGPLWQSAFEALVENAEDAAFLSQMFGAAAETGLSSVEDTQKMAMAERLLGLGFPVRAAQLAPPHAGGVDGLFPARLARSKGDIDRAIDLARDADGPQAERFLADTLAAAGRHSEAQGLFAALDLTERSDAEAWRAGSWSEVAANGLDARSGAAEAMLDAFGGTGGFVNRVEEEGPPTIESSAALLTQSAGLRDILESLLKDAPRPEG